MSEFDFPYPYTIAWFALLFIFAVIDESALVSIDVCASLELLFNALNIHG